MRIDALRLNESELSALGRDAVALLLDGCTDELAARFGFALAFGREPSVAIREDLAASLAELGATALTTLPSPREPVVSYFEPNESSLIALVSCSVATDNGKEVRLELIITGVERSVHVTLEQISAVR